ncbi:MAG: hypothetical protein WC372_06885 [Candidatus Neomarinimicrobiota bacterium]|jgi:hypothetical protein
METSENTSEKKDIQKAPEQSRPTALATNEGPFSGYLDAMQFNQTWRVAQVFANSQLVPDQYRGKPENCFIAVQMAFRMNIDPWQFLQKTYVVGGKCGMEAQMAIALVNTRGPFDGPIQWRFEGEGKTRKCVAFATLKKTDKVCEATVTWGMVEAEGWDKKSGSKWKTMPDLMFQYRSASFLAKLYCPEVLFGMMFADELEDIISHVDADGKQAPPVSDLNDRLNRKKVDSVVTEEAEGQVNEDTNAG